MKNEKRNILTTVLCVIYLLLLASIILFKLPFYSAGTDRVRIINLIPLQGSFDENGVILLREIIYNILLFIPFGIYICMLKGNWPFIKKVLPIFVLTVAFEVIQYVFAMGRSDITDILGNTFGGIIGIGIYTFLFKIFKSRTVKIINMFALILTVCIVLRFSYLFYLSHFVLSHPLL